MKGEPVVIAKAGKPMVKTIDKPEKKPVSRLGFMKGRMTVPNDFKAFERKEIETMFGVTRSTGSSSRRRS